MTALVWFAIFGGLAIVILAVGIPYLLTHKRMHDPHDTSEGQDYLRARPSTGGTAASPSARPGSDDSSPGPW
jgi:hypothetical protein